METNQHAELKRIKVSDKRQITIPKRFYDEIGVNGDELICELRGNEIILKPLPESDDFSEFIIRELANEGYSGQSLVDEFKRRKAKIRPAVDRMLEDAKNAAESPTNKDLDEFLDPDDESGE